MEPSPQPDASASANSRGPEQPPPIPDRKIGRFPLYAFPAGLAAGALGLWINASWISYRGEWSKLSMAIVSVLIVLAWGLYSLFFALASASLWFQHRGLPRQQLLQVRLATGLHGVCGLLVAGIVAFCVIQFRMA